MTSTIITEGQSLVDVAIQELGAVAALFDLADAAGLAITDMLSPGLVVAVPSSMGTVPAVARYFSGRQQRINTGAPLARLLRPRRDFKLTDFKPADFN